MSQERTLRTSFSFGSDDECEFLKDVLKDGPGRKRVFVATLLNTINVGTERLAIFSVPK
jgi:hypothetical protein